jgi:hypothetical protein
VIPDDVPEGEIKNSLVSIDRCQAVPGAMERITAGKSNFVH